MVQARIRFPRRVRCRSRNFAPRSGPWSASRPVPFGALTYSLSSCGAGLHRQVRLASSDRGFRRRAHRVAAPTLIIWGKADRIIAPAYAQEFAGKIPGAKIEMIDKAGHLPQLEQPDAVTKAVRAFLGG